MTSDQHEHTVKIPAQWRDGKWQLVGGGELPKLHDGAIVDIVFPANYLTDPEDTQRWTSEITVPFLPKSTELLIHVNSEMVPPDLLNKTVERRDRTRRRFVQVVLQADLSISLVPGKKGTLNDCLCLIPTIEQTAESVSEAYKKIATVFEPARRSNAGNVFRLAFIEQENRLIKLDMIRDEITGRTLKLNELHTEDESLKRKAPAMGQQELFE
jgi:hypothetical protein